MADQKYLQGLLKNDREILEEIYDRFSARITELIVNQGGTIEDARDVFHDALMVIYEKVRTNEFELTSSFYTYLHSVSYYIWDRKRKKMLRNAVTVEELGRLTEVEGFEKEIHQREKDRLFLDSFQKLGPVCQQLLELFFAKTSIKEIARQLQLKNEHAARTRKYRCQKKLEDLIKKDERWKDFTDSRIES